MTSPSNPIVMLGYGSRSWVDAGLIQRAMDIIKPRFVVHGDHHQGADYCVEYYAERQGIQRVRVPAAWRGDLGRAAGPYRNTLALWLAGLLADQQRCSVMACGFRMPGESKGTDDMTAKVIDAHEYFLAGDKAYWALIIEDGQLADGVTALIKADGWRTGART